MPPRRAQDISRMKVCKTKHLHVIQTLGGGLLDLTIITRIELDIIEFFNFVLTEPQKQIFEREGYPQPAYSILIISLINFR